MSALPAHHLSGTVCSDRAEARLDPRARRWLLRFDLELAGPTLPRCKPVTVRVTKAYEDTNACMHLCKQTAALLRRGTGVHIEFASSTIRAGRLDVCNVGRITTDVPTYIKPYN
jgi:hypothetical protein